MRYSDKLLMALTNTVRTRFKSKLTIFSVAVGIASVILIASLGESSRLAVQSELNKIGINGITVFLDDTSGQYHTLNASDAAKLKQKISGVKNAMPLITRYGQYSIKNVIGGCFYFGVDENMPDILDIELLHGRNLSKRDVDFNLNVAIIDNSLAQKIYKRDNVVGKTMHLFFDSSEQLFTIVGVVTSQKSGLDNLTGGRIPDIIYIPYTTAAKASSDASINQIALECMPDVSAQETGERASKYLNRIYKSENAFTFENMSGYVDNVKAVAGMITAFIAAIAGISLIVAGLGVMNMMLTSVSERKREIGVYMALGAKKRDISDCFLLESIIISASGGLIGAIAGLLLALGITACIGLTPSISFGYILSAEAISVCCGLFFGVIPAHKASRLNPIDVLKEE